MQPSGMGGGQGRGWVEAEAEGKKLLLLLLWRNLQGKKLRTVLQGSRLPCLPFLLFLFLSP